MLIECLTDAVCSQSSGTCSPWSGDCSPESPDCHPDCNPEVESMCGPDYGVDCTPQCDPSDDA